MKSKKAYIQIIEAVVAIMIIAGAILVIFSNQVQKVDISNEVYEKQRNILNIVSNNESMRTEIIGGGTSMTNEFILKNIPNTWNFTTNICNVEGVCNQGTPNDRNIYVSETIISSNLTDYPNRMSKKLRFFIWRK